MRYSIGEIANKLGVPPLQRFVIMIKKVSYLLLIEIKLAEEASKITILTSCKWSNAWRNVGYQLVKFGILSTYVWLEILPYNLLKQEEAVKDQIKILQDQLDFLHYKMWYFKTSLEAGTEAIHFTQTDEGMRVDPDIHEQYEKELQNCHDIGELVNIEKEYQQEKKQSN